VYIGHYELLYSKRDGFDNRCGFYQYAYFAVHCGLCKGLAWTVGFCLGDFDFR